MKVSVSLPDEDLAYIDEYTRRTDASSRSAVLHRAIALLRMSELEDAYASAWNDWDRREDHELWNLAAGDGLADAAR